MSAGDNASRWHFHGALAFKKKKKKSKKKRRSSLLHFLANYDFRFFSLYNGALLGELGGKGWSNRIQNKN